MNERHVIVGASAAGTATARALREHGYQGEIVILEAGSELPYELPPLSKTLATGLDVVPIHPTQRYIDADITLRLNAPVRALDPARREVVLESGEVLTADHVILATGGTPRSLPMLESSPHMHTLRSATDARALAAAMHLSGGLVVLGGGFIGLEVAASAAKAGLPVQVIERSRMPLEGALGYELASGLLRRHEENGVEFICNAEAMGIDHGGNDAVLSLDNGTQIRTSCILLSVGCQPRTQLAVNAGIECDEGVLVDRDGRTSNPWVSAVGDVAQRRDAECGLPSRFEHWQSAIADGERLGAHLSGASIPATGEVDVPYFWSEQGEAFIQRFGAPNADDEVHSLPFVTLWTRSGRLVAAAGINANRELRRLRDHVGRQTPLAPGLLAAPDVTFGAILEACAVEGDAEAQRRLTDISVTAGESELELGSEALHGPEAATEAPMADDLGWEAICGAADVAGDGEVFAFPGSQQLPPMVVVNSDGAIFATARMCTHAAFELDDGYVANATIECPVHMATFCLRTGKALKFPATEGLTTFDVKVDGGQVRVRVPSS